MKKSMDFNNKKNIIFGVLAIFIIFFYIYIYIYTKGVLHPESLYDISNFMSEGGMHGFKDFIKKSFNLNMIEHSFYRPRLLGFMIQYLDIKLWYVLNSHGLHIGGRFLFTLLAIPLTLLGGYFLIHQFYPRMIIGKKLFVASSFLMVEQYIVSSILFLRSAKVISPAVSLCITALFIYCYKKKFEFSTFVIFMISFVLSILITIDEQCIYIILVLLGGQIFEFLYSLFKKQKMNCILLYILFATCILYVNFYFGWGRTLFSYFTKSELHAHPHGFLKSLTMFHVYIKYGVKAFVNAFEGLCGGKIFSFVYVFIYVLGIVISFINKKYKTLFQSLYLQFAMMILSIGMVGSHPPIATIPSLSHSIYYITSMFFVLVSYYLLYKDICVKYISGENILIFMSMMLVLSVIINYKDVTTTGILEGDNIFCGGNILEYYLMKDENYIKNGITIDYFEGLYTNEEMLEGVYYRKY